MNIVHFDEIFHPDFGYQINILTKFQVRQGHEVTIVTGDIEHISDAFKEFGDNSNLLDKDKEFEKNTGVKIIRLPVRFILLNRTFFKNGFNKIVDNLEPDILFCHFNDTAVGIYYILHVIKLDYPVVFDSHMLEMASKNPFNKIFRWWYKHFITPTIIKQQLKVIRTQDDSYVEKCLGIPLSQAPFISVGADTVLFKPDYDVRMTFRKRLGIGIDDFVVVYTGKLTEAKGGLLLAEAFKEKFILANERNVILIVVGNTGGNYGKAVEELLDQSKNRIIRFPTQKYTDLAQFYQLSDLSVFPKQCSLSFFDTQACGLPVVSEDNNINVGRLSHDNGFNFRADDVDDFREKIISCAGMTKEKIYQMRENALNYVKSEFNYYEIADKYTEILINEVKRFNNYEDNAK